MVVHLKWKACTNLHCERRQPHNTRRSGRCDCPRVARAGGHVARLARAAASQLPAVLRRPEHLAHRHMDDAHRHVVAGLPAYEVGAAAGHGRLRGPDSHVSGCALRRRVGRSARSPPGAGVDPGAVHGAVAAAGRAHVLRPHHGGLDPGSERDAGPHQRLRHARTPGLHGADGGRPRRPLQRHRHQLLHGQRGAAHRPVAGRHGHRRQQRGAGASSSTASATSPSSPRSLPCASMHPESSAKPHPRWPN